MKLICKIFLLCITCIFSSRQSNAQLKKTAQSNAQALVQKLLGPGVTVSNVSLAGQPDMTRIFNNTCGTKALSNLLQLMFGWQKE